jgi:hypothetical protein
VNDVEWLVAVGVAVALMFLAWLATVLAVVWALYRSNRVDPAARGMAPLSWLLSPAAPARLHRRLRGAVRLARGAGARGRAGRRRELVDELAQHAVALDRDLVLAAAFPRPLRRERLAVLAAATAQVEASAVRLADLAVASAAPVRPWGEPADADGLRQLAEHIDHLAGAHEELRRVEAVSS